MMKLSTVLLLPALIGAASAASDASVYIFQGRDWPNNSNPPTLSPEQARLIFAQRLSVSQYHGLGDASEDTLSHINTFGGRRESLFQDVTHDKAAELVLMVNGASHEYAEPLLRSWKSIKPAFKIASPPTPKANLKLVQDLEKQLGSGSESCDFQDSINPFNDRCWNGKSKVLHMDLSAAKGPGIDDLMAAQSRLKQLAKDENMHVVVVLMPESSRSAKALSKPYGSYEMPLKPAIGRRQAEEPITEIPTASSLAFGSKQVVASNSSEPLEPITGVPPVCHVSLDSCVNATNSCSGHGECYKKYGPAEGEDASPACYACGCVPTKEHFLEGKDGKPAYRITHWGGAACQKKDVSGPFWLFAIFTVVMIGLVTWAVGMLFSIGEEELPGVIGAGVSSKSR